MSSFNFDKAIASPTNPGKAKATTSGQVSPENYMSFMTPEVRPVFSSMTGARFDSPANGGTPSRMFPGDARLTAFGMDGGDPFVSSVGKVKNKEQKLSPDAADFQPTPGSFHSHINGLYPGLVQSFGSPDSLPAQQGNQVPANHGDLTSPDLTSRTSSQGSDAALSVEFSTDGAMTRVLKLSAVYREVGTAQVDDALNKQGSGAYLRGSRQKLRVGDAVLIRYTDIRDAEAGYNFLKVECPDWQIEFVEPGAVSKLRDGEMLSKHEGQIYLIATLPSAGAFNRVKMEEQLRRLIATHGDLYAFQKQLGTEAGTMRFVAEFCDVEAAKYAVTRLNGTDTKGMFLEVGFITPDITGGQKGIPYTPIRPKGLQDDGLTGSMARMGFNDAQNPQIHGSGYTILSPTSRTFLNSVHPVAGPQYQIANTPYGGTPAYGYASGAVPYYTPTPAFLGSLNQVNGGFATSYHNRFMDNRAVVPYTSCPAYGSQWNANAYTTPINQIGFATPMSQMSGPYGGLSPITPLQGAIRRRQMRPGHMDGGNPAHNVVDLDKIRRGIDVRTTIMLRNIPNKIDQVMLKQIVDESSFGVYDFMYLRIDFANNCNVGYAFINFEDPYGIIDFVTARAGKRWNKFNSDKVAEVSYATIQGKDCLVQKFRNSSVMLEHPSFRPKIFFTQGHPLVGQEEEFAGPDNPSKMRRSVENAEHVGLFAPRAGQHYRDEQRRRKSKYDRGTRLAEMEENEYEYDGGVQLYHDQYQAFAQAQAQGQGGYPMAYDRT